MKAACVRVRACVRASHRPQKASCVISSNPLGGVKPAACSGKNTVEAAAGRSGAGRSCRPDPAAAPPPSKPDGVFFPLLV